MLVSIQMDKSNKQLFQYIKKSASSSFLVKISGLLVSFILQIMLARTLGVAEFGVYSFVITLVVFSSSVSALGMDKSIIRFLPEYLSKNEIDSLSSFMFFSLKTMLISLAITLVFLILFQPVFSNLSVPIGNLLLFLMGILVLSSVPTSYMMGLLLAMKKPVISQAPSLFVKPVLLLLFIFLYFFINAGALKASDMLIANALVSIIVLFFYILIIRHSDSAVLKLPACGMYCYNKDWWSTSIGFLVITMCNLIITQTDIIMIGSILSPESVAHYMIAVKVSSLLTFFLVSVNTVVAPLISESFHGNNRAGLVKIVNIASKIITITTLVAAVVIVLGADYILQLFGEEYLSVKNVLIVLCIGHCINALTGPVSYLVSMTGHQAYVIKILAASAVINVALNWVFINQYGIIGAAYATAIATIVWNVSMYLVALKKLNINTVFFKI